MTWKELAEFFVHIATLKILVNSVRNQFEESGMYGVLHDIKRAYPDFIILEPWTSPRGRITGCAGAIS